MAHIRWYKLIAIGVAVASILIIFAALRTTWYHEVHGTSIPSQDIDYRNEIQYSLDGQFFVDGDERDFWSFEEGQNFWEPREPMHSFTERIQILLTVGAILSGLWALLMFFEKKLLSVVAGVSSAALFGISAVIFYGLFGSAYAASDLPGTYMDFPGFFVTTRDEFYGVVDTDIWEPMLGWWLAIAACAVMVVGMTVLAVLRRRESRTVRGTRPSQSPSGQPSDPSRQP